MEKYDSIVKIANRYYDSLDYKNAVIEYRNAFSFFGGKGMAWDRYKVAKAWAQLGYNDSAFFNLFRLADKTEYLEFIQLTNERDFDRLHSDDRWNTLLLRLNPHREIYNDSLAKMLEAIHHNDQKYRSAMDSVNEKFGNESKESQELWAKCKVQDSVDLREIIAIIDKYGWLSPNEVGQSGNKAIWLVIQHAPLDIQEKYYPIMQKAVADGKASKIDLAYLQDRILMRQGKKQLYGTQYKTDYKTNTTKLWDVESPDSLNIRRQALGLYPITVDK